ncbi:hypothetical protein E3E12_07715 [Formicincola oecophyllae]|uniref:Uncharacterized protein n=1 Tax=Formicincola oecophyllae TaxID=2558361 RepID=A0A4Y6U9M3_9PROT|nr:hypothetical protein [Formicincola oecophyllae]QDH14082.1 hypothetical protein E3E12_07715 [Formicincola oecophyllae]
MNRPPIHSVSSPSVPDAPSAQARLGRRCHHPEQERHVTAWLALLAQRLRHQGHSTPHEKRALLADYAQFLLEDGIAVGTFCTASLHALLREREWFPTYATLLRELRAFQQSQGAAVPGKPSQAPTAPEHDLQRALKLWAALFQKEGNLSAVHRAWPTVARQAGLPACTPNRENYAKLPKPQQPNAPPISTSPHSAQPTTNRPTFTKGNH